MTKPEKSDACCTPQHARHQTEPNDAPCSSIVPQTRGVADDLVALAGGWFAMGADDGPHPGDGEGPVRNVWVDPFSIAATAVTNAQFRDFVHATGYQTIAEQQGWSFVFHLLVASDQPNHEAAAQAPWWRKVEGTTWAHPHGPNSCVSNMGDHPVVHIALPDALAYCHWAGRHLPSEAEWEFAARGGLEHAPFPWGQDLQPDGQVMANIWQGGFPHHHEKGPAFTGTEPVDAYTKNGFGLSNMSGNVWEWTSDRFTHLHSPRPIKNPKGPLNGAHYVAKGGSYLCHASYCLRYRVSSRQSLGPMTTAGNIGFRVCA